MAELVIKISGDSVDVENALRRTNAALGKTEKQSNKSAISLKNLKMGYAAVAGILTGVVAKAFAKTISLASDFEETNSKFQTVFKDVRKSSEDMAKDLEKNYGLSILASRRLLSNTGDLLTGFGFAGDAALKMSGQVQKLAVDLGSFQNVSTERASEAITKALLGETEMMKGLGVAIRQNTKEFQDNVREVMASTGATMNQAKAQVIMKQIMEQSKNAIGDFGRTSKSFANQMKILRNNFENFVITLGTKLLPVATKVITALNDAVEPIKEIIKTVGEMNEKFLIAQRIIAVYGFVFKTMWNGFKASALANIRAVVEGVVAMGKNIWAVGKLIKDVLTGEGLKASFDSFKETIKNNSIEAAKNFAEPYVKMKDDFFKLMDDLQKKNDEKNEAVLLSDKKTVAAQKSLIDKNTEDFIANINKQKKALLDANTRNMELSRIFVDAVTSDQDDMAVSGKKVLAEMVKQFGEYIGGKLATLAALEWAQVPIPITGPAHIPAAVGLSAAALGVPMLANTAASAIMSAPHGADFVTNGQTQLTVGDNPSGRERVTVTPEEDMDSPTAGGNIIIQNMTVVANNPNEFGQQMREFGIITARRA